MIVQDGLNFVNKDGEIINVEEALANAGTGGSGNGGETEMPTVISNNFEALFTGSYGDYPPEVAEALMAGTYEL